MKLGLEIHQRLNTHKLFCSCPNKEGESEPKKITRTLHPVYSELGEMDVAAKKMTKRNQTFEYLFYDECNCLVELDEEPPHYMNLEALKIGLEIAKHLNSKPIDEIHIMRKIVIDGSNTAGFQRTALIAYGGEIKSTKGNVKITTIAIEEESARIIERKGENAVYSLDRLGVPLVEITTEPDIKDSEHLKEIAEKIGLILRATGKVARGLGTIRQDVNISIENGARVEIKGAQDLKVLPLLVENEAKRQQNLIELTKELNKRFNTRFSLEGKIIDASALFFNTESKLIKSNLEKAQKVFSLKLENHAGILGREINPNRSYGKELNDYAKTAGAGGIIHSDENIDKYGIKQSEVKELRRLLNLKEQDSFVLVIGKENTAKHALENVLERARMNYIPKETRKAEPDGTSSYLRPLPGQARLYPETDHPPIKITEKILEEVALNQSEGLEEKRKRLLKILSPNLTEQILRSKHLKLFEKLTEEKIEPALIVNTLINTMVMLRREGVEVTEDNILSLFSEYKKEKFVKAAIPDIFREMAKGKEIDQILNEKGLKRIRGEELKKIVQENNKNLSTIMSKYRLRIDAQEVLEYIK